MFGKDGAKNLPGGRLLVHPVYLSICRTAIFRENKKNSAPASRLAFPIRFLRSADVWRTQWQQQAIPKKSESGLFVGEETGGKESRLDWLQMKLLSPETKWKQVITWCVF